MTQDVEPGHRRRMSWTLPGVRDCCIRSACSTHLNLSTQVEPSAVGSLNEYPIDVPFRLPDSFRKCRKIEGMDVGEAKSGLGKGNKYSPLRGRFNRANFTSMTLFSCVSNSIYIADV